MADRKLSTVQPVFSITQCWRDTVWPVGSGQHISTDPVLPVSASHWFSDTTVPSAPLPITSCLSEPIPVPAPDFPCPVFSPLGLTKATSSLACVGEESLSIGFIPKDCCSFDLDVEVAFPCPRFPTGEQSATQSIADMGDEHLVIEFVNHGCAPDGTGTTQDCGFDINVDVAFPCPSFPNFTRESPLISLHTVTSYTQAYIKIFIIPKATTEGHCGFDFDLDVAFPCPDFPNYGYTNALMRMGTVTDFAHREILIYFIPKKTEDGECGFDFDVDIAFPCPTFPSGSTESFGDVTWADEATPSIVLDFLVLTEEGTCGFSVTPSVLLPCPEIGPTTTGTGTIELDDTITDPVLDMYFDKVGCAFTFNFSLRLPVVSLSVVTGGSISGSDLVLARQKVLALIDQGPDTDVTVDGTECSGSGSGSGGDFIGVLDGPLAPNGYATVSVWTGAGNSESDSGVNVTAYNWLVRSGDTIPTGKRVVCRTINNVVYAVEAEC